MIANPFAGMFSIDPNSTPQQIAERRARIAAMMPQFGKARYIGEGLGQLAMGIGMGNVQRNLDKIEGNNQQTANDMFSRIFGARDTQASTSGPSRGPLSVLGMQSPTDPNSSQGIATDAMTALGHNPQGEFSAALLDAGLSQHVVDGINMNVADESGFNPAAVGDNGNAFGLAQWNGPRKAALLKFAADAGMDPSSPKVQAQFLVSELRGPEAGAMAALTATQNAPDAAVAFLNKFERPAEQHRARREAAYGGQPAPQTAPPQIPMSDLYAVLSSQWATPEQKAVATSLIEQNTQNADPMRAMELQKAQLELQQMQQPGAGADVPSSFAALDLQARAAGYEPGTPEYKSWMRDGGGSGAPAAFTALDMQARASGYKPGTPEYKRFMASRGSFERANDTALGTGAGEAIIAAPAQISNGQIALQGIEEIRNHEGIDQGTGITSYGNSIRGTAGYAFETRVQQLAGGAFLTAIQQLQGMGALSNAEGQTATAALARLQTGLSRKEFEDALSDYEGIVKAGMERAQGKLDGQATPTPIAPMDDADYLKSLGLE